jgi:hypothetical protein
MYSCRACGVSTCGLFKDNYFTETCNGSEEFVFKAHRFVFKAHRLLYHSTLGSRVKKNKRRIAAQIPLTAALC